MTAHDEETGVLRCDDCSSTGRCRPDCSHVASVAPAEKASSPMPRFSLSELEQLLIDIAEYLDQRADCDMGPDGFIPNRAMVLGREVDRALAELKSGPVLP